MTTITPLDSELRAEIKADLKNRRGPFHHAVVAAHELVGHYRVDRIKPTQATAILRELSIREVVALTPEGRSSRLFLMVSDPALMLAGPMQVRKAFLQARGL